MVTVGKDCYLASGHLPSDYAWLRFMAKAMGGEACGCFNERL